MRGMQFSSCYASCALSCCRRLCNRKNLWILTFTAEALFVCMIYSLVLDASVKREEIISKLISFLLCYIVFVFFRIFNK